MAGTRSSSAKEVDEVGEIACAVLSVALEVAVTAVGIVVAVKVVTAPGGVASKLSFIIFSAKVALVVAVVALVAVDIEVTSAAGVVVEAARVLNAPSKISSFPRQGRVSSSQSGLSLEQGPRVVFVFVTVVVVAAVVTVDVIADEAPFILFALASKRVGSFILNDSSVIDILSPSVAVVDENISGTEGSTRVPMPPVIVLS
mmetsp:Transcript_23488/g.49168  ORF Transcript_23488/g.49168 Transcript_23488/m.49168 type:complete len:201 (+) Transcript_23488:2718-3320(+)